MPEPKPEPKREPDSVDRRTRQRPRWRGAATPLAPAMAPMIDVVFLLLIYFLLAADFSVREEIYRLDLPRPDGDAGATDPFRLDQDPLRIAVESVGPGHDDFRLRVSAPYPAPADLAALEHFLRRAASDGDLALFRPDHPVLLEPDAATMWEHAVAVFDVAVKTGYTNVIFVRLP